MKRDLKSMGKGKPDPKTLENLVSQIEPGQLEDVTKAIDYYSQKSESELEQELFRMTSEGMRQGTLTPEGMEQVARQISGMLDPQQQKRLHQLLSQMKGQR